MVVISLVMLFACSVCDQLFSSGFEVDFCADFQRSFPPYISLPVIGDRDGHVSVYATLH